MYMCVYIYVRVHIVGGCKPLYDVAANIKIRKNSIPECVKRAILSNTSCHFLFDVKVDLKIVLFTFMKGICDNIDIGKP
jgi:hypothetical protein